MAINTTAVWEIRPTAGSDTNGGGFDASIASAGTDFSQQNAAQVAVTDAVTNNTTTVTSATANFLASHIGNAIWLSGTGTTTGRYFITAVGSTTSITVDRATGSTGGTGVTLNIGGALASTNGAYAATGGIGSNVFWMRGASGVALVSGAQTSPPVGTAAAPTLVIGYNTTRSAAGAAVVSDLDSVYDFSNFPIIRQNNSANSMVTVGALVGTVNIRNFVVDGGAGGTKGTTGITITGAAVTNVNIINCKATGYSGNGFSTASVGTVTYERCLATSNTGSGTSGFNCSAGINVYHFCVATGLTCPAFIASAVATYVGCIEGNNTGASTDGYQASGARLIMDGCVSYKPGRDCIRVSGANTLDSATIRNCIFVYSVGIGIDSTSTNYLAATVGLRDWNAFYNAGGSAALFQCIAGPHDVTLSSDPFTAGASGDFSLTSTAGGGGACRAAGFPGIMPGGLSTGYMDIGAIQAQAGGGSVFFGSSALSGGLT